ncbi:MAG: phytanoyl-CoA dioxygenase family protein [Xanthomonadales bacterium]|nr:phytanoyl-CoA dioxygenase family protein [Xanthomonadales bacterium]
MNILNDRRDPDDSADRLITDGFLLLPELCSNEFLQRLLDVSRQRIRDVRRALGTQQIGIGSAAGYDEIVQRSPGRWDLPISPERFGTTDTELPWWPLVVAVLGQNAEPSFSGVVFSEPGSPAQFWHIDSPHLSSGHLPAHALNVLVALQDIPMEMGPTEIARGSHALTNHLSNPALVADELVYQHAGTSPGRLVEETQQRRPEAWVEALTAGSCLLFDDRILHRGLANRSERTRYVAYFSYRKKGYSENTHFESQYSVFGASG